MLPTLGKAFSMSTHPSLFALSPEVLIKNTEAIVHRPPAPPPQRLSSNKALSPGLQRGSLAKEKMLPRNRATLCLAGGIYTDPERGGRVT